MSPLALHRSRTLNVFRYQRQILQTHVVIDTIPNHGIHRMGPEVHNSLDRNHQIRFWISLEVNSCTSVNS